MFAHRPLPRALMPLLLGFALLLSTLAQAQIQPAPEAWVQAFSQLRIDPPPPELNRKSHFVVSDERHHELFRETVTDLGGIYIGVGTDQNYTLAAWAKPEVIIMMDFDMLIPKVHQLYRLAFLNAEGADDFIDMWGAKDDRLKTFMEKEWTDADELKAVQRAHRISRALVHGKLRRLQRFMKTEKIDHFLTDPAQFQWIVEMFRNNRVYMVRGDLTGDLTVLDIAEAAKKANLPVRVLYVSNAEAYFRPYPPSYLRNMAALPMDDRSVLLRTMGFRPDWSPDPLYEYNIQTGENFQLWMNKMTAGSVRTLVRGRQKDKAKKISFSVALPPEPKAKKEAKK